MGKLHLTIIFDIFILIMVSCLEAGADAPFIYRGGDKKDPFVPLVTKDGRLMATYGVINSIDDVILEGIVYDPEAESIAILNGLILKENDQVGIIKIKRIERNSVTLICEGEEYTFEIKE